MALFGKKKKAEPAAPISAPEDDIQIVGGDADETDIEGDGGGQVIDFDAIADELGDDDGGSELGEPMGDATDDTIATVPATALTDDSTFDLSGADEGDDVFNNTPGFEAGTSGNAGLDADDELDFDSVFDDGSPAPATTAATTSATTVTTGENPFGDASSGAPSIEPVADASAITADAPPLTHTAPITTGAVVTSGAAPAVKKPFPLLPLLAAAGLLLALGAVAYMTLGRPEPVDEAAPIVAANPALDASDTATNATNPATETPDLTPLEPATPPGVGNVPVGNTNSQVNPGIAPNSRGAVDGVPIEPGVVMQQAPLGAVVPSGPRSAVPPNLQKRLKDLWNQGAKAKRAKDFAGARAAWLEILRLDPGHDGIQSAIDKLPPA